MTVEELILEIKAHPDTIDFNSIIETIDNEYFYIPSKFTNGKNNDKVVNESGTNEGSCKIFAFSKLNRLTKKQALACFGKYYREDVLLHPNAVDHANIRTLMKYSLDDIIFDKVALMRK